MLSVCIDYDSFLASGGSIDLFGIVGSNNLGFKQFHGKLAFKKATYAWKTQQKLAKFNLAPKVIGKVCKVKAKEGEEELTSNWGYITELVHTREKYSYAAIEKLVNDIKSKTNLKFWDCHDSNIGILKNRLVCIDTGLESFDRDCNAWGFREPGPRCVDCNKYQCSCCDY